MPKPLEEITEPQGYEEACDYSERAEEAFARLRRLDEVVRKVEAEDQPGTSIWTSVLRRLLDGEER